MRERSLNLSLQDSASKLATFSGTAQDLGLSRFRALIITLDITSAERDTGNETYDVYITTSDGVSSWDLVHFSQIASTGAKRFTARVLRDLLPQSITTAAPGVAAVESGTLATVSGGTNAIKSLGAGLVRHGPWGDTINQELVVAGTIGGTGLVYSLKITAVP
jgi:hypothetical protein